MKTKPKLGRPRLPAGTRTVWLSARLSPEAAEILQERIKETKLSTGKLLSQILVTLYRVPCVTKKA